MRRADRLFQLVTLLRRKRRSTARTLAEALEVSERTIYRDVADLLASGVPIEGEAGVGYRLRAGYDLPPLRFSREELEALVLGMRMVQASGDRHLGHAATTALAKVEAALPPDASRLPSSMYVPPRRGEDGDDVSGALLLLRGAIHAKRRVSFGYARKDGAESSRTVWPLGIVYWGMVWSVTAWCELREDFRSFRVDRMTTLALGDAFPHVLGRTLDDFLRSMGERARAMLMQG